MPGAPGSGLATRCPACSTVFRVVPDQLRVSEGWVRCGRCSEVFNAAERLVDVDTGAPRSGAFGADGGGIDAPAPAPEASATSAASAAEFTSRGEPPAVAFAAAPGLAAPRPDGNASAAALWADADAAAEPPWAPAPADRDSAADPGIDQDGPGDLEARAQADAEVRADPAGALAASVAADEPPAPVPAETASATDPALPSFVRRADRAQRWREPRVRNALVAAAAAAALLLALQAAFEYRDAIAARWPPARAALAAACGAFGCRVGPVHAIESLSVESSGLVRVEKSSLYRLSVALRNRARHEVALPAVELTLTNAQGALLARRVLQPADFGVQQATVGAGRDAALQATLQTSFASAEPVAGYTVELFYP